MAKSRLWKTLQAIMLTRIALLVMLLFIVYPAFAGCITRDVSSPQKALLGHWKSEDDTTEAYFSESKYTWVDKSGKTMTADYTILESNLKTYELKIRVKTGYEMGHDKLIIFSDDRRSITEEIQAMGTSVKTRYKYVDAKMSPYD